MCLDIITCASHSAAESIFLAPPPSATPCRCLWSIRTSSAFPPSLPLTNPQIRGHQDPPLRSWCLRRLRRGCQFLSLPLPLETGSEVCASWVSPLLSPLKPANKLAVSLAPLRAACPPLPPPWRWLPAAEASLRNVWVGDLYIHGRMSDCVI